MFERSEERPPPVTGGPLGIGDPNDRRLRKTESDIIIPKLIRAAAEKKCSEPFKVFLDCAKEAGIFVTFKCREQSKVSNDCISKWCRDPEFTKQITEKYIDDRNHYRRTGEAVNKYVRVKKRENSDS